MRLCWITDPHLDHLGPGGASDFGLYVKEIHEEFDAVVITGDIGECHTFAELVESFAEGVSKPVWFVLGNHDCYGGSISQARVTAGKMKGRARWLVSERVVQLTEKTALVGHDGWYDARFGDYTRSQIVLNDFLMIKEFQALRGQKLADKLGRIADLAAQEGQAVIEQAIDAGNTQIVFATHVPPFAQATWHEGAMSDKHWLPWMSSRAMGEMLRSVAQAHPTISFLVLCGHTHSDGKYEAEPNLVVLTGHSAYKYPRVCGELDF